MDGGKQSGITDELRRSIGYTVMHGFRPYLLGIADCIDAEHEKALREAYTKGYEDGMGEANKADMRAECLRGKNDGYDVNIGGSKNKTDELVARRKALATSFKVECPRRQAMLSIRALGAHDSGNPYDQRTWREIDRVPVLVWPNPTADGLFVVEHQDGTVEMVQPAFLTFLGSKELFDQYDWSES